MNLEDDIEINHQKIAYEEDSGNVKRSDGG